MLTTDRDISGNRGAVQAAGSRPSGDSSAPSCGGNDLFAGRPIYVQRRELDNARSEDDYTIGEWAEAPGVRYVPVAGELELLPGLRLGRPGDSGREDLQQDHGRRDGQ